MAMKEVSVWKSTDAVRDDSTDVWGFFLSNKMGWRGIFFPSGCLFLSWSSALGYERAALCLAVQGEAPESSSLLRVIYTFFFLSYI